MITQLGTVLIYVENQEESLKFWTEKMGFEIKGNCPMSPYENWIELAPKGAQSAIVLYPKSLMPNWEKLKPSIVFFCDDVIEVYSKLSSNGVEFTQEPTREPWGLFAIFADIDKNEFVLKEPNNMYGKLEYEEL